MLIPAERLPAFHARVDRRGDNECWPWTGNRNSKGYGLLRVDARNVTASRIAWSLSNGRDFPSDRLACHTCDNPPCVNPAHIWAGTPKENTDDMYSKGRRYRSPTPRDRSVCPRGHPKTPDNLVSWGSKSRCKTCWGARKSDVVERVCGVCASTFQIRQKRVDAGEGIYCSRACVYASRSIRKAA